MAVDVRLGRYAIRSDSSNWMICEVRVAGEDAKEPGREYVTPVGYFPRLTSALDAALDLTLRDSDATTLAKIREGIASFRRTVEEQLTVAYLTTR